MRILRFGLAALLILPMAVNPAIAGLIWKLMFSFDFGIINALLSQAFGIKIVWLGQAYALFAVIVVLVWMHFPLSALMFLAVTAMSVPDLCHLARGDEALAVLRLKGRWVRAWNTRAH